MPLYHRLWAAPVTLLLLATFDATMVSAQQMDGWPDWLVDGMAREIADLESQALSVADGKYRFRLAGESGEPVEFDGGWYFESDIGADAPLECYLYTEEKDLATFIVNLANMTMEAQGEAYGSPAGDPSLFTVDAGAIDDAPYLALEWVYTLGEAPNLLIGLVKARAAVNGDVVQACVHNLVGYRDTFEAAFDEFVRSAEVPDRVPSGLPVED